MSAPYADTAKIPVVPGVGSSLVKGVRDLAQSTQAPGRAATRRARRNRRLLALCSIGALALLVAATVIVIGVVR